MMDKLDAILLQIDPKQLESTTFDLLNDDSTLFLLTIASFDSSSSRFAN